MDIAIIGGGAIGATVAGYLHKKEKPVTLVAREEQVKAIQSNGLTIRTQSGAERFDVKAVSCLDRKYDLVIFATKTQDLEDAYAHNKDFLDDCPVLTTQNGVQADTILSCHFEPELMYSSIVMFGATYGNPGEITYNFPGDWILGKPYTPVDPRMHKIADELKSAFSVVITDDIVGMKWLKLFVNFNNCIPALLGTSMQETFADIDMCRLSILLLKEGLKILGQAQIAPVSLPAFPVERITGLVAMPLDQAAAIIQKTLTGLSEEPLFGSILQSILRGRTSEIDFINGEVVHMATQMRTEAPINAAVVDMVHNVERSNKFYTLEQIKKTFTLEGTPQA